MASGATIIELFGNPPGEPVRFTCDSGVAFEKGDLLWYGTSRKLSGAYSTNVPFAGVAAMEKVAADASTSASVYTKGIFGMYAGAAITAGDLVFLSGQNMVYSSNTASASGSVSGGRIVGEALTTAAADDNIAVMIGRH